MNSITLRLDKEYVIEYDDNGKITRITDADAEREFDLFKTFESYEIKYIEKEIQQSLAKSKN